MMLPARKLQSFKVSALASAVVLLMSPGAMAAEVYHGSSHVFSINDVQGGFNGDTYAENPAIICGLGVPCPTSLDVDLPQPTEMKLPDGQMLELYPVNSEFGFKVSDFVGAAPKTLADTVDGKIYYGEGYVANVSGGGVAVSNASTELFKVKPPMGTWCGGLGATSVKCSTEHYSVLEHVKTCYETIPYFYADAVTGEQGELVDPETGLQLELDGVPATCEIGRLDNALYKVIDGVVSGTPLISVDGYPDLPANESTVLNDIAVSTDYAVTKKDDGKPLYRWGDLIKRPNDVRLYAKMALPDEWKNTSNVYRVKTAWLTVVHTITNNPNDQIRPEDMENEGATGRLPTHTGVGDSVWTSAKDCYEGDGHFIPEGTVLKNTPFKVDPSSTDPYPFSSDLKEALTNAWYTTIDRDPFEWDPVSGIGPRWRLKPNKFGQDIPGLEIPAVECSAVPFSSANIKYPTGDETETHINLLDFEDDASPLKLSTGWTDNNLNFQNLCPGDPPESGVCAVSVNGLPMTDDFDLALYIKGDKKPAVIKSAWLNIIYDDVPIAEGYNDLLISSFVVPDLAELGTTVSVTGSYYNDGTVVADGYVQIVGWLYRAGVHLAQVYPYENMAFSGLDPGMTGTFEFDWIVDASVDGYTLVSGDTIVWYVSVGPEDDNPDNSWTWAVSVIK